MNNSDIRIRFGDLISELSKKYENIEYSIITTMGAKGSKSLKEVLSNYDLDSTYQRMIISIKSNNELKYRFFLPFTVTDLDSKGYFLKDHLDVNVNNNGKKGSIFSTVVVNKDIEDIMLNIDDVLVNRNEDINFYPANFFKETINNNNLKRIKRK